MATGIQLREDMDKGVFDRFKSLPIARIAPLAGPAIADLLRYGTAATLTILTGIAMGYRPGGGFLGVFGGWLLTIVAGWSLAWIFTWLGTVARSAQAVQGISMMIMFPLTFLSNAFVPVDTLPGWLEAFVKVNPVSHVVTAVRDLMNEGQVTAQVGWALVGCARRRGGLPAAVGPLLQPQDVAVPPPRPVRRAGDPRDARPGPPAGGPGPLAPAVLLAQPARASPGASRSAASSVRAGSMVAVNRG